MVEYCETFLDVIKSLLPFFVGFFEGESMVSKVYLVEMDKIVRIILSREGLQIPYINEVLS